MQPLPLQQIGEHARTAAEVGHARAARETAETDDGVDQPRVAVRREHVVAVGGRVAVEERDLFCFVLCRRNRHGLGFIMARHSRRNSARMAMP